MTARAVILLAVLWLTAGALPFLIIATIREAVGYHDRRTGDLDDIWRREQAIRALRTASYAPPTRDHFSAPPTGRHGTGPVGGAEPPR